MVDASTTQTNFQNTSLYVGDLDSYVTEAQLLEKFSTVGNVALVRICRDKITRQSLGYAYVNFSQPSEAERALDTLNFDLLVGKPMRIMWSQRDPAIRRSGVGNVFIKNLDRSIDNKSLYDTFSTFGNIISCKIMSDENGSKGYGFVHFETHEAAEKAIQSVNNMSLNGKIVYVGPFLSKAHRYNQDKAADGSQLFTNLYVKNFDADFDDDRLRQLFEKFGELTSVKIARDPSGRSLGYGFVNFKDMQDAAKALKEISEIDENNNSEKKLYVSVFQKKSYRLNQLRKQYEEKNAKKYSGINLFVKNLDDKIEDERLKREFAVFGQITSAKVMLDSSGRSKGFGFVCYSSPEEATKAVAEMNGRIVGTKPLYVAMAQRKDERRKILAAQFRERMQNTQFYLQAPNPYYQQQVQGRLNPFQNFSAMRNTVPRWPQVAGTAMPRPSVPQNYYMQQVGSVRNNSVFAQQQQQQQQHQQQHQQLQQQRVQRGQKNFPSTAIPGQEPLTTGMLAAANPQEQKQMLGERLYPLISGIYPDLAGKITGMLLEIENSELLHMLDSSESLKSKVEEAVTVLRAHQQHAKQNV